jgi:hypothetical protein
MHDPHEGFCVFSNVKNALQLAECAPVEHAVRAFARSVGEHAPVTTGGLVVVTFGGQKPYGAGHVPVCMLHARGVVVVSHVSPSCVQFAHDAPLWPHCVSRKPAWQVPFTSQQPAQLVGVQLVVRGTHLCPLHTSFSDVQSRHCAPPVPHAPSCVPTAQTLPVQQPFGHVAGVQTGGGGMH